MKTGVIKMKDLSDKAAACYRRYINGDESAVDEIMRELFFNLVCFVESYVHDMPAAEDIAMDVMSDLFLNKHRYNFKVSLKTYVFMRGKSKALDLIRHRKALHFTGFEDAERYPDELFDLEERLISSERKRAVHSALDKLPGDMRQAVYLTCFEELSYAEAARVMGKKPKQIDNLLYRAKNELRSLLGEEGKELL